MRSAGSGGVLLAVLLVLAAAPAPPDEQPATFFRLAVVRRDTILVPFATYDGRRWSNDWPVPRESLDVPVSLRDVPSRWWGRGGPADLWTFWPLGEASRPLKVLAPAWFPAHCLMNVGLRTDYAPAAPIPAHFGQPHPKDGLATTGPVTVEPIALLDEKAPEWNLFNQVLQERFNEAETAAVRSSAAGGWGAPYSEKERAAIPATIEVLCRSRLTGDTFIYYFEAVKRYEKKDDTGKPACFMMTHGAGWIRPKADGRNDVEMAAVLANCDRDGVVFMLPLGLLRLGTNPLWVVQWGGWGYERYEILEVGLKGIKSVFQTPGGGC